MSESVKIKQTDAQGNEIESEVSIADIAGIDMAAVEEFEGGFEATPKGVYLWLVKDAGLTTIETRNGMSAAIFFDLECEQCMAVVSDDPKISPESMVGWKHRETIFVSDLAKSVGQAKAIMTNAGFQAQGSLENLLDGFCGRKFIAPVKNKKDKNDTDRIYANLIVAKITPAPQEATATAAPQVQLGAVPQA